VTDPNLRDQFREETKARYDHVRTLHDQTKRKSDYLSLADARKNAYVIDWKDESIDVPAQPGIHTLDDFPIDEIIPYIDWTYFFYSWDLRGTFPAILDHPEKGTEARKLYSEALELLSELSIGKKLKAKAVIGLFEANAVNDDIVVSYEDKEWPFYQLRDQRKHREGENNLCLSDFIAPKDSGIQDYLGTFVASISQEPADLSKQARDAGDDYRALLIETLCDRMVEAFAELLHLKVRQNYWGYAPNEVGLPEDLTAEKFRGIRPAIGYPSCPDHSEKERLFRLMDVERRIGTTLTDSYMMMPASSVSGFYMANPRAKFYNIIHITKDQADDYFKRKGRVFEPMRQLIL
jgi:5-methyltetrahydrofolate--homocysteine methyltransferase